MRILEQSKPKFFALVILFLISGYTIAEGSGISSDIDAIQLEIKHSQKGFIEVQNSEGKNTQKFDLAMRNLRSRINALNFSFKNSKQLDDSSSEVVKQKLSRFNADFSSLNKARSQSDWRVVERDLARLSSSAKELHSVALNIPNTPGTSSRKPPEPPTASSGSNTSGIVKPGINPKAVGIQKHPLPVTGKPVSKGPDDPRYAIAPHPYPGEPAPEPPPPPPDDTGTNRSTHLEENVRTGGPSMMRKPSRPKGRLQDSIPKPKPVTLRSGNKLNFANKKSALKIDSYEKLEQTDQSVTTTPLSRTQVSEAMIHIRRAYNLEPKSTDDSGSAPFIVMSPRQTKGIRNGFPSDNDFYRLINGNHVPYSSALDSNLTPGYDRLKCSEISSDSPIGGPSKIVFSVNNIDDDKIYLADITAVIAPTWIIDGQLVDNSGGHILYAFTRSDLIWDTFSLQCGGPALYTGDFLRIEIYQVN